MGAQMGCYQDLRANDSPMKEARFTSVKSIANSISWEFCQTEQSHLVSLALSLWLFWFFAIWALQVSAPYTMRVCHQGCAWDSLKLPSFHKWTHVNPASVRLVSRTPPPEVFELHMWRCSAELIGLHRKMMRKSDRLDLRTRLSEVSCQNMNSRSQSKEIKSPA